MTTADSVSVNEDVVVDADYLGRVIVDILVANGASPAEAAQQAEILVEGDLRDQHSHGVRRLPVLIERLRRGLLVSGVASSHTWITDCVLRVDGMRGFGPVVANSALDAIIDRANTTGIAVATVANSNHVGMLAPYIEKVTSAGQIGIALTTSEALVHPWGGATAMVGTNPIGIGVPTTSEPLVLDMSTASVSMGKILDFAAKSTPIPLGWAVDRHGSPTTDAAAATEGSISPFGGPKGYALGLAFEALVGTLTMTALGTDVKGTLDTDSVASKGDVFLTISLDRLGLQGFLPTLDSYLDDVRASETTGSPSITIPGDRARATREHRRANGIPLHPEIWDRTLALLEEAQRG